jgi:hypothetical protein
MCAKHVWAAKSGGVAVVAPTRRHGALHRPPPAAPTTPHTRLPLSAPLLPRAADCRVRFAAKMGGSAASVESAARQHMSDPAPAPPRLHAHTETTLSEVQKNWKKKLPPAPQSPLSTLPTPHTPSSRNADRPTRRHRIPITSCTVSRATSLTVVRSPHTTSLSAVVAQVCAHHDSSSRPQPRFPRANKIWLNSCRVQFPQIAFSRLFPSLLRCPALPRLPSLRPPPLSQHAINQMCRRRYVRLLPACTSCSVRPPQRPSPLSPHPPSQRF